MNIKDLAAGIRRLQGDEAFGYLVEKIKKDQGDVFFNPYSSDDDRAEAHTIIRALGKIEDRMAQILQDEAIYDKKRKWGLSTVDTTELDSFESAVEGLLAPQPEAEEVEAEAVEESEAEDVVEAEFDEVESDYDSEEEDEYEDTEKYVQKGMQEAAAMRKQAEDVYANLLNERQQIGQLLQYAQNGLPQAPLAPSKEHFDSDPIGYMEAKMQYDEAKTAYEGQMGQLQQVVSQQGQAMQYAQRAYLEREMETLKAVVPEFSEPDTAVQARDRLVTMGQEIYGYDPNEIGAVMDHRAIRVLHDAIKYQELMSGKQRAVTNAKPKAKRTVRAGAKKTRSNKDAERQTRQKLKKSGSIEDALNLILKWGN